MFAKQAPWSAGPFAALGVVLGLFAWRDSTNAGSVAWSRTPIAKPSQDTAPSVSAPLLRRLAAAADGYRTGAPVYVVASYVSPYEVVGVFSTRDSALKARGYGRSRAVFGPYVTPLDFDRPSAFLPMMHSTPTIYFDSLPQPVWWERDVDSIAITVYHRSRGTWHKVSRGLEVDALFFSLASIDKFALPYYARLYGPAYADSVRRSLAAYIRTGSER